MRNEGVSASMIQEHMDYQKNLNWGAKFIRNFNEKSGHRYFCIRVDKKLDGDKYYFVFSFVIPQNEGSHLSYANPIDPNQDNENFILQFRCTYSSFYRLQRNWNEKLLSKDNFKQFDVLMRN